MITRTQSDALNTLVLAFERLCERISDLSPLAIVRLDIDEVADDVAHAAVAHLGGEMSLDPLGRRVATFSMDHATVCGSGWAHQLRLRGHRP